MLKILLLRYRIVSDKYIVSCDVKGILKVWDLRSLLTIDIRDRSLPCISSSDLLFKAIPPPSHYRFNPKLVSADEFQFVTFDTDSQIDNNLQDGYFLCVKSFVGKMGSE